MDTLKPRTDQPTYMPGAPSETVGNQFRLLSVIVVLACALHLPTLGMGFFMDDYGHQVILRGLSGHQGMRPWSLFDFGTLAGPGEASWEEGVFPWWTAPDWKARFFRPVTSLTLWLDHALFGDWAPGYHLTSLAWYAGLLVLVFRLYRLLELPPRAAVLALVLFAASDSCVFPVAWPANRNTLLATFFTVSAVLALSRHETRGRCVALTASLVLAYLACLSKESGIVAFALVAVYLWRLRSRSQEAGVRIWTTWGICLSLSAGIAYVLFLWRAGYGTNCLFYVTPWRDTGEYLARLATLATGGVLGLMGLGNIELMMFFPRLALSLGGVLFVGVLGLAWVLFKYLKGQPGTGYLTAWMALLILPQACAPPSERLLFGASIGSSGLLAWFVYNTVIGKAQLWRPRLSRALGVSVLLTAGVLSGVSTLFLGFMLSRMAYQVRETILTAEVGDLEASRPEVFVLQSPNMLVPAAMLSTWGIETGDRQVRFWPLQTGRRGLRWTRLDERTFELESLDQLFLTELLERLFLTNRAPPVPGTKWQTALFTAEAAQLDAAGLRSFVVRCPESLDAPEYRFLVVRGQRLVTVSPPAVGESIVIQTVVPPHSLVP